MQKPAKTYSTAEDVEPDRDELTALRRRIHQHPELSHKEVETARLVAEAEVVGLRRDGRYRRHGCRRPAVRRHLVGQIRVVEPVRVANALSLDALEILAAERVRVPGAKFLKTSWRRRLDACTAPSVMPRQP